MHDWFVWCKSNKGADEIRSFELSGKEIFSNLVPPTDRKEGQTSLPLSPSIRVALLICCSARTTAHVGDDLYPASSK